MLWMPELVLYGIRELAPGIPLGGELCLRVVRLGREGRPGRLARGFSLRSRLVR